MKKIIILLALAMATLASPSYSADEGLWKNWGAAPFAPTLEEAFKKASAAIDSFNLPLMVKIHFKSIVADTCKCRIFEEWLTPGMLLEEMWSGGQFPHVMKKRTVGELPVLRSRDHLERLEANRLYRTGSVAETAKVRKWQFAYEGKTYILYLPYVCYNWAWAFGPPPALVPVVEKCVMVKFTVKPGDEVRFAVLARKLLPSSICWQLCDGDNCSMFPSPCDTCGWYGPKLVIPSEFQPLHTGRYIARSEHQTLRFPIEVIFSYIALCDERFGLGESDSWIIQPSAWIGVTTVVVPYGGQEWPAWGKVDFSKWKK